MKRALILATGTYADSRITPLKSPVPDAERLRLLLTRKDVGPYEVTMLSDAGLVAQRVAIERYFQSAGPDDTLLLFISGHGDKDSDGDLYFLAQDTDRDLLSATAIGAHFVSRQAARSRARQKVLVIDTCYSGAFAKGHVFKSGAAAITAEDFGEDGGRGTAIITAASSTQLASEASAEGRMQSRFTRHLIEGIETGAADANGTGSITLDELFDYVRGALRREGPGQEPKRLNAIDGDVVIARNPVRRASPLAPALQRRIASRNWETRAAACIALSELVRRGGDEREPARAALTLLADDPDDRVKRRAQAELGQLGAAPDPKPPIKETTPDKSAEPDKVAPGTTVSTLLGTGTGAGTGNGAVTDETTPKPKPKPKLDGVAWTFIILFAILLLAAIIAIASGGGDKGTTDTSDTGSAGTSDPMVDAAPPTSTDTMTGDASVFGTGGSEYASIQASSISKPELAQQCNTGATTDTAEACNSLGVVVENGDGGAAADFVTATNLYEKACYYGSVVGCANAGMRLTINAGGVTVNGERAVLLLSTACGRDDGIACERLGWAYETGFGTTANSASATEFYTKSCNLGTTTGCTSRDRLQGSNPAPAM